jgi:hypothetical protein
MSASQLTGADVARMWLYRGIADLYFGFHTMGNEFSAEAMFMQIMALEKHLKAVLLFERRAEYEQLTEDDARRRVNDISKRLGHKFAQMSAIFTIEGDLQCRTCHAGLIVCGDGGNMAQMTCPARLRPCGTLASSAECRSADK